MRKTGRQEDPIIGLGRVVDDLTCGVPHEHPIPSDVLVLLLGGCRADRILRRCHLRKDLVGIVHVLDHEQRRLDERIQVGDRFTEPGVVGSELAAVTVYAALVRV